MVLPENVGKGSAQRGEWSGLTWRSDPQTKSRGLNAVGDLEASGQSDKNNPLKNLIRKTAPTKVQPCPSVVSSINLSQECTRYILTNVGSISTVQMYSALEHSLRHCGTLFKGIVKIKPVLQPNRRRHFDIWVKHENSAGLQKALRLDYKRRKMLSQTIDPDHSNWSEVISKSMLPRYRLYMWKAYRDCPLKPPGKDHAQGTNTRLNLLTWNINGIKSKLPALKHLLQEKQVAIPSIQEHLRTLRHYVPGVSGYSLFDRPKEKGFRGQCLYVHQALNAHKIDTPTKHIIYVKVYGQTESHPWHILSVYMPSRSSRGKDRGAIWGHLYNLLKNLLKNPDTSRYVTILGDPNDQEKQILHYLR